MVVAKFLLELLPVVHEIMPFAMFKLFQPVAKLLYTMSLSIIILTPANTDKQRKLLAC